MGIFKYSQVNSPIRQSVAVIDDDVSVREAVSGIVMSYGYEVMLFDGGADFLAADPIDKVFCAVVDIQMPGLDGLEVQRRLNQMPCALPLIFMTALRDEDVRARAMAGGALGFLHKPVDHDELFRLIRLAASGAPT